MDPENDYVTAGELKLLKGATSQAEWDATVAAIKERRGGLLPPDWMTAVIASGLQFAKQQFFEGVAPDHVPQSPSELKAELLDLRRAEEDLFMAALAIQTAIGIRSAEFVSLAISKTDGHVVDVVVLNSEGKQVNQRTKGLSHIYAMIACGREVHRQLMLLHQNTGKLTAYVDRVKKLDEIRRSGERKIISPSGN